MVGETATDVIVGGGGGGGVPWLPQPAMRAIGKRKMQEGRGRTLNSPFRRNRCGLSAYDQRRCEVGDDITIN